METEGHMSGYEDGEAVRLVVPAMTGDGREVQAGWTGSICMLTTTLMEAQKTGVYEVSLDEKYERQGQYWPLLKLPSTYFERASETRRPGELRQGDRVRLPTDMREQSVYEAGTVCTVLNTRSKPNGTFHDVLPDFGEVLMELPKEQLEPIPGCSAEVTYKVHGESVTIGWNDTSFSY
jgi:hypothetical protein